MRNYLAFIILLLACLQVQAQQVFRGPVDFDYDNMQEVALSMTDAGKEFSFTTRLVDEGERTLYIPTRKDLPLHERELYLFAYQGKTLLGANVKREDAEERIDTLSVMSFNIKRIPMTVSGDTSYDGNTEIELSVEPADTTQASTLVLSNKEGEQLTLTLDYRNDRLLLEQGEMRAEAPLLQAVDPNDEEQWRLRLFLSHNTIEVFVNEGRQVLSRSILVSHSLNSLTMKTKGGKTTYSNIYFYKRK